MLIRTFRGSITKSLLSCAILLAFSCSSSQSTPVSDPLQLKYLDSLNGHPGVIGDPNFNFDLSLSELHSEAWRATGFIQLYEAQGKPLSKGNGIIVGFDGLDTKFVLTAKHVIYDPKTLLLRSQFGFIGLDPISKAQAQLDLASLPEKVSRDDFQRDFLLVPIKQRDNVSFQIHSNLENWKLKPASISLSEDLKSGKLLSIGSTIFEGQFLKFSQSSFQIFVDGMFEIQNQLASDLDAFSGLSGAPIFFEDDSGVLQIIGVLSQTTRIENCKEFSRLFCSNTIAPVTAITP